MTDNRSTDAGSTTPASEGLLGHREDCGCAVCRAEALGSTTREGGEVVPPGMKPWPGGYSAPTDWDGGTVRLRNGQFINRGTGIAKWLHASVGSDMAQSDCVAYFPKEPLPVTTSSPDASPDSGEGAGIMRQALEAIRSNEPLLVQGVQIHDHRSIARHALAASPASLSGGAEERDAIDDYAYDELWDAIAAATRVEGGIVAISVVKFREAIRALAPSPEAPANRQEAGQ